MSYPTLISSKITSRKPSKQIVQALELTPEEASQIYLCDVQQYSNLGSQDPSKALRIELIHYINEQSNPRLQRFRGMGFLINPLQPDLIKVVVKSYPYADPITSDELPERFREHKFSVSRQGFVARVFKLFGKVHISTHRKLDCVNSRFGESKPMKEMFQEVAEQVGLDVNQLFDQERGDSPYCHIFFVSHEEMRLLRSGEDQSELIYLGSLKQEKVRWVDVEEDDPFTFEDMVPVEMKGEIFQRLRP